MSIISPLAQSLTPYVPGEQPRADIPWIKLNTNENPYPPSPAVRPAIEQAAACLPLYPEPTSHLVRQAVAHRHGLTAEQVFVGNGSDDVLALCFPAFFQGQRQPIRMADITYSFYHFNLWYCIFCCISASANIGTCHSSYRQYTDSDHKLLF